MPAIGNGRPETKRVLYAVVTLMRVQYLVVTTVRFQQRLLVLSKYCRKESGHSLKTKNNSL